MKKIIITCCVIATIAFCYILYSYSSIYNKYEKPMNDRRNLIKDIEGISTDIEKAEQEFNEYVEAKNYELSEIEKKLNELQSKHPYIDFMSVDGKFISKK